MDKMKPRERVLKALEHKEPDRVPISFSGTVNTNIVECPPNDRVYTQLCEYLGIKDFEPPKVGEAFNQVMNVDERIKQKFGSDLRFVLPSIAEATVEPDGTYTWEALCGMRIKKFGLYDEPFDFPMRNWTSRKDIENYPYWPDPGEIDIAKGKREEARNLRENTDYAIVGEPTYPLFPFNGYGYLSGLEKWLIDMKLRPDFYFALSDKLLEIALAMDDKFLDAVGEYLDIVEIYDDLGTQEALLFSHADYVKFYKPYTKQIIEGIKKKHPHIKILFHSCGSVYEAIPDLIEIGVDILNPVQPLARNMEPWRLKKEFGKELCFCGGVDIQKLLPRGTSQQVREGVKKVIEQYAPGGGYILATSHNIEPDTPPENIVAMFEAAQQYGKYPISC